MAFTFRAWQHADIGKPGEIVAVCNWIQDKLPNARRAAAARNARNDILFEVIDVRPGAHAPGKIDALVENLTKLMLADSKMMGSISKKSQLLFVGETPALGSRTVAESDRGRDLWRDPRYDVEFAIRVLRSYGVALYGCIDENLDLSEATPEQFPRASSARRLFEDFYVEAPSSQAEGVIIRSPSRIDTPSALRRVSRDFTRLLKSVQELPEFKRLGTRDTARKQLVEPLNLLREIGILFELGRGERPKKFAPRTRLKELGRRGLLTFDEEDVAHSSYSLFVGSLQHLARWVPLYRPRKPAHGGSRRHSRKGMGVVESGLARGISMDLYKLERFNLLRDFGRVLGQGALPSLIRLAGGKPHILIVDDWLFATLRDEHKRHPNGPPKGARNQGAPELRLVDRLRSAIDLAWKGNARVRVVQSREIDADGPFGDAHFAKINALAPARKPGTAPREARAFDLWCNPYDWDFRLDQLAAILIDPESTSDTLGATRVQRLAKYFEQAGREAPPVAGRAGAKPKTAPPVIAFSQKEGSGHVQQCLNMGASAFVAKHRPFHLLFDLARIERNPAAIRDDTPGASQFRLLHGLKPNVAAKLKRQTRPFCIQGGTENADENIEINELERNWVNALPKADLHYHLGTAIDLETVALLALNTAGHFLSSAGAKCHDHAAELVRRMVATVALAANLARDSDYWEIPHIELLAAAAHGIRDGELKWTPFGLGDDIVAHLHDPNQRCDAAHATALLVAAIEIFCAHGQAAKGGAAKSPVRPALQDRIDEVARYFRSLTKARRHAEVVLAAPASAKGTRGFSAVDALSIEARRTHRHFQRLALRWAGESSLESINRLIAVDWSGFWGMLGDQFQDRVALARDTIAAACAGEAGQKIDPAQRDRACAWVTKNLAVLNTLKRPGAEAPTLASYVGVPEAKACNLQLYLRGADLLGSAHLQYPENLLIAAYSITRDNVRENVIYSEVRCETTGYTKVGMGAHDATEMLRHGFNLGSLFWASKRRGKADDPQDDVPGYDQGRRYPLVRTNILLAAKRHKSEPAARAVVELLDHYLERRPFQADRGWSRNEFYQIFGNSIPVWWRPSDVVGFDISGNEAVKPDWLEGLIGQLTSRSSPITIHAGEAASAQSIWHAVYKLNALRIGHGLRLVEDLALLGYCVREGICMELCPNSNLLTNAFEPPAKAGPDGDPGGEGDRGDRYAYPLLRYMRAGMEVTIGTDNRYLHAGESRSLTSEYLMAARLVGGLTRWEVLQIVKAGFKNAFLDKSEVRDLVGAAEEAIYGIISADSI